MQVMRRVVIDIAPVVRKYEATYEWKPRPHRTYEFPVLARRREPVLDYRHCKGWIGGLAYVWRA
jgi:hypothetical protein